MYHLLFSILKIFVFLFYISKLESRIFCNSTSVIYMFIKSVIYENINNQYLESHKKFTPELNRISSFFAISEIPCKDTMQE